MFAKSDGGLCVPNKTALFGESLRFQLADSSKLYKKRRFASRIEKKSSEAGKLLKRTRIKNGQPCVPTDVSIGCFGVGSVPWNGCYLALSLPGGCQIFLFGEIICVSGKTQSTQYDSVFSFFFGQRDASNQILCTSRYSSNFAERSFCDEVFRKNFVFVTRKIMGKSSHVDKFNNE